MKNTELKTEMFREKENNLKPRCLDCGGLSSPLLITDDEWSGMTCLDCVERKHKGIIRGFTLIIATMFTLTTLVFPSVFSIAFIIMELAIIVGFWPYHSDDGKRRLPI